MYQSNLFEIERMNFYQAINQFIRAISPPSFEANMDFNFLTAWGCEEYIKRTRYGDVERMRAVMNTDYHTLLFSRYFQDCINEDKSPNIKLFEKKLKGHFLVKAKKDLFGLFNSQAPEGCIGVVLWKEPNGSAFVWFLSFNFPMIKPLIGPLSNVNIDYTGAIFESFLEVMSLSRYQKDQSVITR